MSNLDALYINQSEKSGHKKCHFRGRPKEEPTKEKTVQSISNGQKNGSKKDQNL